MVSYYVQSLFILFAAVSLLGSGVASLFFNRLDSSARYWVVATWFTGITTLVTVFRNELPLFWAYSAPIGLSGVSFVLMGLSIARLYDKRPPWRTLRNLGVITLVFIAVMELCRIHAGPKVTLILSGLCFGLTSLWSSHPAHVHYRLTGNRFSMYMRWIFIGTGLLHLLRMQGALTGWGVDTFGRDAWNLGIWSFIFMMGLVRYFGYLGIRIQEQYDQKLQIAQALAREEEGRRLGAQLARLERQQSLGIMSASFAHELNQPLAAIMNYAELLQHQLQTGTLQNTVPHPALDGITANSARAGDIIRRIRSFIQPAALSKERVDLRSVVNEVCALVQHQAQLSSIKIVRGPMPSPMWVLADAVQLSQVLFNVLRNAMESTANAPVREIHLALTRDGPAWLLSVNDSGPGLSEEAVRRVGDAFYTTKMTGLGMGLSISKTILAQFGGQLLLANTGSGACAEIRLPVTEWT